MGAISLQHRTPGSVAARDRALAGADSGHLQRQHPPGGSRPTRPSSGLRRGRPSGAPGRTPGAALLLLFHLISREDEVDIRETNHREMPNRTSEPEESRRPARPGHLCLQGRDGRRRGQRAEALPLFVGAHVRRGSAWKAWAPHAAAGVPRQPGAHSRMWYFSARGTRLMTSLPS